MFRNQTQTFVYENQFMSDEDQLAPVEDITSLMIPIQQLEYLQEDDILDALEDIFGEVILNVSVDDVLNKEKTISQAKRLLKDQKVVVLNTMDSSYWCCGNIFI